MRSCRSASSENTSEPPSEGMPIRLGVKTSEKLVRVEILAHPLQELRLDAEYRGLPRVPQVQRPPVEPLVELVSIWPSVSIGEVGIDLPTTSIAGREYLPARTSTLSLRDRALHDDEIVGTRPSTTFRQLLGAVFFSTVTCIMPVMSLTQTNFAFLSSVILLDPASYG